MLYSDLTYFLNAKMGKEVFFKPDTEGGSPSDRTITFKTEDKSFLYLTSDTFGFSAMKLRDIKRGVYPYAKLLETDINNAGFIAESVYSTRVLGGSFIWPKVNINGKWKCLYNYYRGAGSRIEDRVDLTLFEIKCFYDVFSSLADGKRNLETFLETYQGVCKGNVLFNHNSTKDEWPSMYKWLSVFGDFNSYVEFFDFEAFTIKENDNYVPVDITQKDRKPLDINNYTRLKDADADVIITSIENVVSMTKERSEKMETDIMISLL